MNETRSAAPSCSSAYLEQLIARDVVGDDVAQMQTLGRRVLDVAHVEIKAAAIEQESAVAGRLFVVAIMQIDRARLRFAEKIILHPHRPGIGMGAALVAADKAAVFRFDPGDAIHSFARNGASRA